MAWEAGRKTAFQAVVIFWPLRCDRPDAGGRWEEANSDRQRASRLRGRLGGSRSARYLRASGCAGGQPLYAGQPAPVRQEERRHRPDEVGLPHPGPLGEGGRIGARASIRSPVIVIRIGPGAGGAAILTRVSSVYSICVRAW